jgi:hypothetical protein
MANVNDAYKSILLNKFPENSSRDNIVGFLLGKLVSGAYYINEFKDIKKDKIYYYTKDENNKIIKLDIIINDDGKNIDLPLAGTKYQIIFYKFPYIIKKN